MTTCDPHWTSYLSALLVPAIAVLGVVIAYRQWRTAQNKLKLDLFEKRFAVYDAARRLVASVLTSGRVRDDEMFKCFVATREAKWILSEQVAQYLDKVLRHRLLELQALEAELEGVPVGPERSANVQRQTEIKNWLGQQFDALDENFAPYLRVTH